MADATWYSDPSSGSYNAAYNWFNNSSPGIDDTAFFNASEIIDIYFTDTATNIGGWTFDCGQITYGFTIATGQSLSFRQAGITIVSGHVDITVDGFLGFGNDSPTAGAARITVDHGGTLFFSDFGTAGNATIDSSGHVAFGGNSHAGTATITEHEGSTAGVSFGGDSSAENASITVDGSIDFSGNSTAGAATIINNADLQFFGNSKAGTATITTSADGRIWFYGTSNPGNAAFITEAGGVVDFSPSGGPAGDGKMTAGSIAGLGNYYLGTNELTVGSDNRSAVVGGEIHDGGSTDGNGASLVKVGAGTLTLAGSNTFSGGLQLVAGVVELAALRAAGTGVVTFKEGSQTLGITDAGLLGHVFGNEVDRFGAGDAIDLAGLAFKPGAAATYNATSHVLAVSSGGITDALTLVDPAGTHFAALGDHVGGTRVVLAIVGSGGSETIDATHHPVGQASSSGANDVILSLAGKDTVKGLGGADILVGGVGRDTLYGGIGPDSFVFQKLADSTVAAPDLIVDFSRAAKDKIDLFDIDANANKAGNQAFVFIGGDSFAHYHQLHPGVIGMVRYAGGVVQGNVNIDLAADFAIMVHGATTLHANDFVL